MKIKFFAWLKEEIGSELQLTINKDTTIKDIKALIQQNIGEKAKILDNPSILSAINYEYTTNDSIVKDSDEVAFFPPVSGG